MSTWTTGAQTALRPSYRSPSRPLPPLHRDTSRLPSPPGARACEQGSGLGSGAAAPPRTPGPPIPHRAPARQPCGSALLGLWAGLHWARPLGVSQHIKARLCLRPVGNSSPVVLEPSTLPRPRQLSHGPGLVRLAGSPGPGGCGPPAPGADGVWIQVPGCPELAEGPTLSGAVPSVSPQPVSLAGPALPVAPFPPRLPHVVPSVQPQRPVRCRQGPRSEVAAGVRTAVDLCTGLAKPRCL